MSTQPKKAKNWEELINDGENYAGRGAEFTPVQKALFECIRDKVVLKVQDHFVFTKLMDTEDPGYPVELAKLIAGFEPLDKVTSLIITHNKMNAEAIRLITESRVLGKIEYLHLGSNALGDDGARVVAEAPMFSEVHTLNLECNGIGPEGAKALAASPHLTKVTSLSLVDNRVGEEGAYAFADSDTFSNLTYLHLGGNRIKSDEAKKALRESPKLSKIEKLKVF
ncbi:hypothetical protein NITGR_1050008 [Nitrospina gracilis 3/211]|uniref:Uncharacterized protein n=1 Tax=Nitrospina gracilis (strain 3/211) TaxID=1266370 RepID=M1YVV8_NITG3|nr:MULTISPECIES: hypothetical protein [Nitrospina]MCF8722246.1 hypothetical protein [Nitrospina sp. Nb-3]CCQ89445.1 hypothetical protein NITGR_1050008 [Nitrospina gracilis 3/211]